jgi:hypothetical protein
MITDRTAKHPVARAADPENSSSSSPDMLSVNWVPNATPTIGATGTVLLAIFTLLQQQFVLVNGLYS